MTPQRQRATPRKIKPPPRPTLTRGRQRFTFARETWSELKKVVWPTRQEAVNLTIVVIVVSAAVGLLLGFIDLGFSRLVDLLLLR